MLLAKKGSQQILLDLAHIDEKIWSGGKYRSTQTKEIFEDNGFETTVIENPPYPGKLKMLLWSLSAMLRFGIYRPFTLIGLRVSGHTWYRMSYFVKHYGDVTHYLIEGTGFGTLQGVEMLKRFDKKVILMPINVESLVPHENGWTHTLPVLERIKVEIKYYQLADAVFCISSEESWLLNILGCRAFFLPYYPPNILMKRIIERRERRLTTTKSGAFYFANFENYPNYLGFIQFVNDKLYEGKIIRVAGLSVHKIIPFIQDKREFVVLGELSDEALETELCSCEYVILNHFPTGGTLTRIPELLISGIPVQGNDPALKSYKMMPQDTAETIEHLNRLTGESTALLLKSFY